MESKILISHTNKYQTHVGYNYGYKLVCTNDYFSEHFKLYLGQDAVHKFITSMTKENRNYNCDMKKYFDKEINMTKEENKNFENSTKCCICDISFIEGDTNPLIWSTIVEKHSNLLCKLLTKTN